MKIAVIVAMDKEMRLLLPLLEEHTAETVGDVTLHHGRMGGHSITALKCGIGKVNAALRAQWLVEREHPELVINTGVAGGTGATDVLDVVAGAQTAYHDVWCGPGTVEGQAAECPPRFDAPAQLLQLPALQGVKQGLIASGDRFVATADEVAHILSVYPEALACDMESAAIAHACHHAGVPFLSLRVVSDTPGRHEDNVSQYENFWDDAPAATFGVLRQLLTQIPA